MKVESPPNLPLFSNKNTLHQPRLPCRLLPDRLYAADYNYVAVFIDFQLLVDIALPEQPG